MTIIGMGYVGLLASRAIQGLFSLLVPPILVPAPRIPRQRPVTIPQINPKPAATFALACPPLLLS